MPTSTLTLPLPSLKRKALARRGGFTTVPEGNKSARPLLHEISFSSRANAMPERLTTMKRALASLTFALL